MAGEMRTKKRANHWTIQRKLYTNSNKTILLSRESSAGVTVKLMPWAKSSHIPTTGFMTLAAYIPTCALP